MTDINDYLISQFKELKDDIRADLKTSREENISLTKSIENKIDDNTNRLVILETHIKSFEEYTERRLTNLENKSKENSDSFELFRITFEVLNRQFTTLKDEYEILSRKTFGESKHGEDHTVIERLSMVKNSIEHISNRISGIEDNLKKIIGDNMSVEEMYRYYVSNKFYNNYIIKTLMFFVKYKDNIMYFVRKFISSLIGKLVLILCSFLLGTELAIKIIELFSN